MRRPPKKTGAFTLIELLTAVAVIGLLIAILMPSLSRARQQGRTVMCLSNLSQLGVALQLYADRNREFVPQTWGGPVAWGQDKGALYKLMVTSGVMPKSDEFPKVLVCPDARPRGSISYALNSVLFGYQHPPPSDDPDAPEDPLTGLNVPPMRLGMVGDPSKVVGLYDVRVESLARVWGEPVDNDEADISDQFTGNAGAAASPWTGTVLPNPAGFMWQRALRDPCIEAVPPHGPAHNILFADTHAATHRRWQADAMTRLVGWEPNDAELY